MVRAECGEWTAMQGQDRDQKHQKPPRVAGEDGETKDMVPGPRQIGGMENRVLPGMPGC